jgi:hypothetical protein
MTNSDVFYPEMNQEANSNAQLIVEMLYKQSKVTCLEGIELKENRSIKFQYESKGNKVYYVSESGLNKLSKIYRTSYSQLLD